MDRINIQINPYKMKFSLRIAIVTVGLMIAGLAILRAFHLYHWSNFVLAPVGFTLVAHGLGLNPGGTSKKLYLIINDSKIEYNFSNIGRPTLIMMDDLDSISFNEKRLRFDFRLKDKQIKKLFLRTIPGDKRNEVVEEINRISPKNVLKNKR